MANWMVQIFEAFSEFLLDCFWLSLPKMLYALLSIYFLCWVVGSSFDNLADMYPQLLIELQN